jgi:hypothetical protein
VLRWFYFGEGRTCEPRGGTPINGSGVTLCQYPPLPN